MQYTKFLGYTMLDGEKVAIMKYQSKSKIPYCDCDRCGKPISRTMYVVQNAETDVEMLYLGSECINHLNDMPRG